MASPLAYPGHQRSTFSLSWPVTPAPAPLVFVDGSPSITREAVAECLVLLMGDRKAVLIDIRHLERKDGNSAYSFKEEADQKRGCYGGCGNNADDWPSGSITICRANDTGNWSNSNDDNVGRRNSQNSSDSTRNCPITRYSDRPSLHLVVPENHGRRDYRDPAFRNEKSEADTLACLLTREVNAHRIAIVLADDTSGTPAPSPARQRRTWEAAALQAGRTFIPVVVGDAGDSTNGQTDGPRRHCPYGNELGESVSGRKTEGLMLSNVSMAGAHDAAGVVAEFVYDLVAAQRHQRAVELVGSIKTSTPLEHSELE